MRRLTELLDNREIRSLPKKVSPKIRPIDFFWQKTLEINRHDKTQTVYVENFPQALIELECSLQDIKTTAAKRARPSDEKMIGARLWRKQEKR